MLSYLGRSLRCPSQGIYRHLPLRSRRNFVTIKNSRLWIDDHKDPIPWVWLRDACQCEHCVHPSTKQKLHRSSDIPLDISPISANAIKVDDESLILEWPETSQGSQASHHSRYPLQWLERHASRSRSEAFFNPLKEAEFIKTWNAEKLKASTNLWVNYNSLVKEEPRRRAFKQLLQYGILFVKGVDTAHKADEDCELLNLSQKFGRIRSTFYGRVWNVKSIPLSRNIAYTNLNLDMHMDLLYFESPPRYQVLHSLVNRVEGGTSIFVDGIERAQVLRKRYPDSFNTLVNTPVNFHYDNDGHFLHQTHPTIELDQPKSEIQYINYSPPFQAPFPLDTPPEVWKALKVFSSLVEEQSSRFEYTMQEGDAVVFDNRRILHARTAFRGKDDADGQQIETNRWLKGCYLEVDALHDQARMLFS